MVTVDGGFLEDGYGETWSGQDVQKFYSRNVFQYNGGKFDGAMSLIPDSQFLI